jgi:hypothetical protein
MQGTSHFVPPAALVSLARQSFAAVEMHNTFQSWSSIQRERSSEGISWS